MGMMDRGWSDTVGYKARALFGVNWRLAEQGTRGCGGVEHGRAGEQSDWNVVAGYSHGDGVEPAGTDVFARFGGRAERAAFQGSGVDGRVKRKASDRAMVIAAVATVWNEVENDANRERAGEGLCAGGV